MKTERIVKLWAMLIALATAGGVAQTTTGSGAPSGAHYNLNLIGVPHGKTANIATGNRIFVPEAGSCEIRLSEGDFSVLDGNCTDGSAGFQLPNPDPTNSGTSSYSVYVRSLGKPGGSSTAKTCAVDPTTGETWCSVNSTVQVRTKGKSSFTNVTKDLLYVYADVAGTGSNQRIPLFDSRLENYYWQYDNNGLKLAQLRFYPTSTNVP